MAVDRTSVRNTPERLPPKTYIPAKLRQHGYSDAHIRPTVSRGKEHGKDFRSWRGDPETFAWDMPEIELNAPNCYACLILDLDGGDAELRLVDAMMAGKLPAPSWWVVRKKTGNAHAVWCLSTPVHRTYKEQTSRLKPQLWFERIAAYYAELLNADSGYTQNLTHNPVSERWAEVTTWGHRGGYTLRELAVAIPKGWRMPPRPRVDDNGSRRCTLFNAGCMFVKRNPKADVLTYLTRINPDIAHQLGKPPLLPNVLEGIARRAVKQAHKVSLTFRRRQSWKGERSGQVRRRATADRDKSIIMARRSGRSLRRIAADHGLSLSGVGRILGRLSNANI